MDARIQGTVNVERLESLLEKRRRKAVGLPQRYLGSATCSEAAVSTPLSLAPRGSTAMLLLRPEQK